MFERFRSFLEGVRRMFTLSEIKTVVGKDVVLSSAMIQRIELWGKMHNGEAPWTEKAPSLRLEAGICREFADIAINEMEAAVDNDILNDLFREGIGDLNENLQDGLALGSFIMRPFQDGGTEYITADSFVPIEFDGKGGLRDCLFIQHKPVGEDKHFYRCERHKLTSAGLTITNKAFMSNSKTSLGRAISLGSVEEWADLQEEIMYPGMDKMDFGYYKNPNKNRVDNSACGVSIFENAIDRIRRADIQGARLDWEFESGERAVHVDERALRKDKKTGKVSMGKLDQRLYRGLNLETDHGDLLKEYSPQLRNDGFESGLESYKREIEFIVGLAYGDLSKDQNVDKTATEIKSSKERKYNRVTAIQENLKKCLEDYVDALAFYNAMYTTNYEFTCTFKDSILTDEDTERNQDRQDVSMGVMKLEEYRAKWYGEDLETAKKNLPEQTSVIIDGLSMR